MAVHELGRTVMELLPDPLNEAGVRLTDYEHN
jgi:hypothetical protein